MYSEPTTSTRPVTDVPPAMHPCRPFFYGALLAIVASALGSPGQTKGDDTPPPNFIIVLCDNLGYGDIEPFGSTLHRTPNLNRMAREGRKFTHFCVTAGVCTPSRASLMTGCYAQRVGMHTNPRDGWVLRPVSPYGLHPDEVTIAEALKSQGYATSIIGKWHLGDQPQFLPTRQGFDSFFGIPYSDDMTERVWQDGSQWPPLPLMEDEQVIEAPCRREELTKRYTERALDWIQAHREEPFFLYLPQAMPGSTRAPFSSAAFRGKSNNGPWGDSVEELDWSVGAILDKLVELDLAENTLVIWTSDNGAPILRDEKDLSRGSNLPLHGLGYSTSEGAFRVPTIVWQPGKVPAGTVCEELATTMDLFPTLTTLARGDPATELPATDGHDIAPLLFGERGAQSPYQAFFYYDRDQLQAVRSGPWKLFLPVAPSSRHPHFRQGQQPRPLLFDVVEDIACENNVAQQYPDIVARLTQYAEQCRADLGDQGRPGTGQRPPGRLDAQANPQPQRIQAKALDVIEGTRGGRHWADAETAAPKSPEDALATLQIEPGFEIELFAAEPLVYDPVAIAFDHQGRMYVVEYGDYPEGPPKGQAPLSRIVFLEDSDNDGRADRRHVFADHLDFAHSLMAYRDGLLVGAKTKILYLEDTDDDHVADVREALLEGFQPAHPQMQIGNPRWGIDNWIYCNYGPGKVYSHKSPERVVVLPRKDMRFHPTTLEFEADSGMGQFGNTVDRWGRRFYCTNRNPIMTTLLAPSVLARNPYHVVAEASYDVGRSGGETRVYPLVEMKSNYLSHAGTHTSACGTTAYLGDLTRGSTDGKNPLTEDWLDSIFVCEPIGHLVTRSILQADGLHLTATRARPKNDFLASTDTWFRPSSLATGPDGALYLADMYRLWVEHPKFLPPEIAARLDWRAGEDRGRIYRIVPQDSEPRPFHPPESSHDAVLLLEDANAWRQFLGQRLLVERQAREAVPAIRQRLTANRPTTRLHALWTLDGLSALQPGDVLLASQDAHACVRKDAIQLAQRWLDQPVVFRNVAALAQDDDVQVRFQVALTLSASESQAATELLGALALRDGDNSAFADGLLTSCKNRSSAILTTLLLNQDFRAKEDPGAIELVKRLAAVVGARGDLRELSELLDRLSSDAAGAARWQAAVMSGLGQGLPRYRGPLGRLTLARLLSQPPADLAPAVQALRGVLDEHQKIARDAGRTLPTRLVAVELLAHQPLAKMRSLWEELLSHQQPQEIQRASIEALMTVGSAAAAELVLERWPELGPAARGPALDLLLRRTESTRLALNAMADGSMSPSVLSVDQRVRLLKHPDLALREQATRLFGGAVSSNRLQVAKTYEPSLSLSASAMAGKKVFQRSCATCHRLDGAGHEVGPDLSDVRNRSKPALLYDILDPNSKIEPRFTAYSVLTIDGSVFHGLVASETSEAVLLKMADGKQATLGRGEIEQIKANNVSFMPEGIEKDITLQQMADLLEYLKRRRNP